MNNVLIDAYTEATRLGICTCKSQSEYENKITQIKKKLEEEKIDKFEDRFKVLSNPTRLKIIGFLIKQKHSCICEIASIFEIDRGTLSYHLKMMKNIGLIKLIKVGKSKKINLLDSYQTILPLDFIKQF